MSEDSQEPRATVRHRRRWSSVWMVPLAALAVAGWLVWKHYAERGPIAHVRFETADGIKAGVTEIRCRAVRVGVVEKVELAEDLQSVVAQIRIDPDSEPLLRKGTRFWVVKPRVSTSAISGLDTLISGSYIELEPGEPDSPSFHFQGLEEPPVTSAAVPGLRLTLVAADAGSLTVGSPIYYRGIEVGRVERRTLDVHMRRIHFDVFIDDEYSQLVRQGTCFWNTSGIDVTAGADGFKLRTPSFQAMLSGGVSFAVPKGGVQGNPVQDGTVFELYRGEFEANESLFKPDQRILLFFDQSVRGLSPGAPVEFRGIQLGRVVEISFEHSPSGDSRVPVLIEIDTKLLGKAVEDLENSGNVLAECVGRGLRARLSTGSLITGALFVDFDFISGAAPASLTRQGDLAVVPTESSGLALLQDKLNAILTKIEALPIGDTLEKFGTAADEVSLTVQDLRATLAEAEGTLAEAKKLLERDETQNLSAELGETLRQVRASVESLGPTGSVQGDLSRTLDELRSALRSFKTLADSIEEKPNSLLFGREGSGNSVPRARR